MKNLTLISILLFAAVSQAGINFQSTTVLPLEMQEKIEQEVYSRCPAVRASSIQLIERSSQVRAEHIDQGIVDYFYSTDLDVFAAGPRQTVGFIQVQSALYSVQNVSDNRVVSEINGFCE